MDIVNNDQYSLIFETGFKNSFKYPQLKLIAWNRREDVAIDDADAFGLYERNWQYVDKNNITTKERELIDRLIREQGNGVFNV